jgi:hypothetical protein
MKNGDFTKGVDYWWGMLAQKTDGHSSSRLCLLSSPNCAELGWLKVLSSNGRGVTTRLVPFKSAPTDKASPEPWFMFGL